MSTSRVFYEPKSHTWHAEQNCIKNCYNKYIIKYCVLVLVKLTKSDGETTCCPCNMCYDIINKYKVRKVVCLSICNN